MRVDVRALGIALVLAAACGRCGDADPALAVLVEVLDEVEESRRADPARWSAAERGNEFRRGDAVRTGTAGAARLALSNGSRLRMGPLSVVRFGERDRGPALSVEAGVAEIETGAAEMMVASGSRRARVGGRSRVRVSADAERFDLEVIVGGATVETAAGQRLAVRAGKSIGASGSDPFSTAGIAAIPRRPDAGVGDGVGDGVGVGVGDGDEELGPPEVTIPAGESAVIHDPKPPTNVRIEDGCASGGTVRVGGTQRAVRPGTTARLRAGSHRVRVGCDGAAAVTGTVRVVRDSGRRRVKTRAPNNTVEADGRRYTVLYQNRLPRFTFGWPDAPETDAYTLHVRREGGDAKTYTSPKPSRNLRSGAIREGDYEWWFEGGSRRSPTTTLHVGFDNASPVANVRPIADGAVSGTAMEGASVQVNGEDVPVDGAYRFRADVGKRAGTVVIRIAHPSRGIHYYVRR